MRRHDDFWHDNSRLLCWPTGKVAQLVEHRTENAGVGGSNPPLAIERTQVLHLRFFILPARLSIGCQFLAR